MASEDDFEKLTEALHQCMARARAMGLAHTIFLLSMAAMEIADRASEYAGRPKAPTTRRNIRSPDRSR